MAYILDGLYLGSEDEVYNTEQLKKLGITHILTVNGKPISLEARENFQYKYIHALDVETEDLLSHFHDTNQFIEAGRTTGGVYVHCFAGVSRSGTLVVAYVMHKMGLALKEAIDLVKCQRSQISPNPGFMEQLELFEAMGSVLDPSNKKYKAYKLENLASQMQQAAGQMAIPEGSLSADPTQLASSSEISYKCKKCRRPLFRKSGLMLHDEGCGEESFTRPWLVSHRSDQVQCEQSLFVEPIEWMRSQILSSEGKISCPKCSAKLGSYNWSGGRCPCGTWVTPSFHISATKVDECKPRTVPVTSTSKLPVYRPSSSSAQNTNLPLDTSNFSSTIGQAKMDIT